MIGRPPPRPAPGPRQPARAARWAVAALLVACALRFGALPAASGAQAGPVQVQLLAINDFHGQLETMPRPSDGRPLGGAAVMAAYLDAREAEATAAGATSLRVGAGDLVGASPLVSGLLRDEPTIEALSLMRLRYSAVGNHEFDKGVAELRRLQYGGCAPAKSSSLLMSSTDPSLLDPATGCFRGAQFQYLAANVIDEATGEPLFPPYAITRVRGVPIGFVGAVLKETPSIVTPSGVAGVRFLDEAATINRYAAELQAQGVHAVVALLHQGGTGTRDGGAIEGAVVPIAQALDPAVAVVVSGHTHQFYEGTIADKLVTQAGSYSQGFADIRLTLDPATGAIGDKRAEIVDTFADAPPGDAPDAAVGAVVAAAQAQTAPLADRVLGTAPAALLRAPNAAGESALGDLIADAQRAAVPAEIAFTNPGGIRTDLRAGPVTYADLFAVQPFGNSLVQMTLTGAQIVRLLEQQWQDQPQPRVLQIAGLTYAWQPEGPVGARIDPADVRVGGQPLALDAAYGVVVNSYLAEGGDNFTVLRDGTDRAGGPQDLDALVDYVAALPGPVVAPAGDRIQTR
ncbi:MAG TPA: bifunctional metallophosphatase/5'-nucleotidase [Chloroflexota bacterium]|nr:bifunctional metallophosphatase/5'-nucleotidase [Chloroflexota bacterium]